MLYFFPSTCGVSKKARKLLESVIPQKKQKSKIKIKAKTKSTEKANIEANYKLFDLAFIDGVPFIYLAKSKKLRAKVFVILMQNIEDQLNKKTKLNTNLKIVVLIKYHDFLNVFSTEISNTLLLHSKLDHKIEFFKNACHSNLGHSAF